MIKNYIKLFAAAAAVSAGGCTSVKVKPLSGQLNAAHVCIKENPRVAVPQFLGVVVDGFQEHGLTTEVYSGRRPDHCDLKLEYTALRSFDFAPYLSHAELRLFKQDKIVATATYHLRAKGGFSPMKWSSTESKIRPVINRLLAEYSI